MFTVPNSLGVNWIILYFIYGQAFFMMGLATGLKWRRQSQLELARSLPWLAAFGIAHGLNEWGYIFIPLQATYLPAGIVSILIVAHLLLLALSFFFLFQFGLELMLPRLPRIPRLRLVPLLLLALWGVAVLLRRGLAQDTFSVLVVIADGWSRYMLAFPGAILAHLGLLHQVRQVREMGLDHIAPYLKGASFAFSFYAVVGGLIVPAAPVFPANLLNYALLDRTIQIPAPVFGSLCGLAMAAFVVRSLDVFQAETDRRVEQIEVERLLATDRERISRELHDGIIQDIYAAGLSLEDALLFLPDSSSPVRERIQAVMGRLNQIIQDIRSYIFNLQAAEQSRGFEAIIEDLVHDLRLDTLLEVDLEVTGRPTQPLPQEHIAHLTQAAHEALSNVVKHASATHVTVRIRYGQDDVTLMITDDGKGMDLKAAEFTNPTSYGIRNMRTRARLMGGDLALANAPGRGITVSLTAPYGGTDATTG